MRPDSNNKTIWSSDISKCGVKHPHTLFTMKAISDIKLEHVRNVSGISMELLQYRCYGDARLAKPKMLKGMKPVKTFDAFGLKSTKKAAVYDIGNGNICLYMGSMFSRYMTFPEEKDMELPSSVLARKYGLSRKAGNKFVYPDAWCTMYRRNDGYVLIKGLVRCFDDLYCIRIQPIIDRLYECLFRLSLEDGRFMPLQDIPSDRDSLMYYRMCSDLAVWIYEQRREQEWNRI